MKEIHGDQIIIIIIMYLIFEIRDGMLRIITIFGDELIPYQLI
jgi:hypothetical protein